MPNSRHKSENRCSFRLAMTTNRNRSSTTLDSCQGIPSPYRCQGCPVLKCQVCAGNEQPCPAATPLPQKSDVQKAGRPYSPGLSCESSPDKPGTISRGW